MARHGNTNIYSVEIYEKIRMRFNKRSVKYEMCDYVNLYQI